MVIPVNDTRTGSTRIGVMGGMFDPVHNGHLAIAQNSVDRFGLDHLRMIPCHIPGHRAIPQASAKHRLAMLRLATQSQEKIRVDDREVRSDQVSYSISTLQSLSEEFPQAGFVFILGLDSFNTLVDWHRWQELIRLCHFVIYDRQPETGIALETRSTHQQLKAMLVRRQDELWKFAAGKALLLDDRPLDVSSTGVRERLARHEPVDDLLDDRVIHYIQYHGLYHSG